MGFEHEIYFELTKEREEEIKGLLIEHPFFSGIDTVDGTTFFEFRKNEPGSNTADFSVVIQNNGLYIVNNQNANEWADIAFIKEYLIKRELHFSSKEL